MSVDTCAAEFPSLTPYLYSTIGNFMSVGNSALGNHSGDFVDFRVSDTIANADSMSSSPLKSTKSSTSNTALVRSTSPYLQNPRIADSVNTECQDSSDMDSSNTENSSIASEVRGLSKNCAETSPIDFRAEAVTSDLGESANLYIPAILRF